MTIATKIANCWDETPEVRCFELRPADGAQLPAFEPGAHIDVHIADNLVRQYSLWNGPEQRGSYFIGVKREPESRGGSVAMHELRKDQDLTISAPKNNFSLSDGKGPHILLAGGIGITPLLAMARQLGADGRDHHLHLFARTRALAPFCDRLEDDPHASIHLGVDPPELTHLLRGILSDRPARAHLYMCGPGPFMELIGTLAADLGWPAAQIHLEHFSADIDAEDLAGDGFELVLRDSGVTLQVNEDQTIIEAMEAAGIEPLTSCEQGVCGTCVAQVIEGEPDHRDQYFSERERAAGKLMTPCVSRCKGKRLVLAL